MPSTSTAGSSLGLAMRDLNLDDANDVPLSQDQRLDMSQQQQPSRSFKVPKRLALDLSSQPSQDNMI